MGLSALHFTALKYRENSELWSPVLAQAVAESGATLPSLTSGYKALSVEVSGQVNSYSKSVL